MVHQSDKACFSLDLCVEASFLFSCSLLAFLLMCTSYLITFLHLYSEYISLWLRSTVVVTSDVLGGIFAQYLL